MNTATDDFVFGMTDADLIEGGQITEPIGYAKLIGNRPQVQRYIDVIGNEFSMAFPATFGKQGQGVPVGFGNPTLRVCGLTIDATAR